MKIVECHSSRQAYDQAYGQAYYQAHKAERRAYGQAYYQAHKAERRAYNQAYNQAHKAERRARCCNKPMDPFTICTLAASCIDDTRDDAMCPCSQFKPFSALPYQCDKVMS